MRISPMNTTDYQYNLYNDYLEQLDANLIEYSNQNSMSIQYWHIIVNESKNHNAVQMQNSYKNYVFDIYHFVPTLEMSPLTYQIGYTQAHDGTSNVATGNMTLYLIDKPLPGDMFTFYSTDDAHDSLEMFRVQNVRYMRTTKNKLKLYQIDFETAPIYKSSVDALRINNIWYWDTENNRFIAEEQYETYSDMVDNRANLMQEINEYYNTEDCYYGAPGSVEFDQRPMQFLNTILRRVKKHFNDINIKPILGAGTSKIPIDWILQDTYWDTFTCLSQQQVVDGELFNFTELTSGNCAGCSQELQEELMYYKPLVDKVKELVQMIKPFITEEQLQDTTCSKNCCDMLDPAFVRACYSAAISAQDDPNFDDLIRGADGQSTPQLPTGYRILTSAELGPLWISFQNGTHYKTLGVR